MSDVSRVNLICPLFFSSFRCKKNLLNIKFNLTDLSSSCFPNNKSVSYYYYFIYVIIVTYLSTKIIRFND